VSIPVDVTGIAAVVVGMAVIMSVHISQIIFASWFVNMFVTVLAVMLMAVPFLIRVKVSQVISAFLVTIMAVMVFASDPVRMIMR